MSPLQESYATQRRVAFQIKYGVGDKEFENLITLGTTFFTVYAADDDALKALEDDTFNMGLGAEDEPY